MSSAPSEALPEERQREILRRLSSHGRVLAAELSTVKRAMTESSGETAIVVTSDKFTAVAAHQIAALDQIDHLVVEHGVDRNNLAAFEAKSINVHRADKG
jgi:DeoR/GlpR family transcriptional regulator of sugar metabolism